MEVRHFHAWDVTPKQAIEIQQQLRAKVIPHGRVRTPGLVAGADVAFVHDTAVAERHTFQSAELGRWRPGSEMRLRAARPSRSLPTLSARDS